MAEQIDNRDPRRHRTWRELWQMPTLLLAALLLLSGVATMVLTQPRPDVAGMVARAERLVEADQPQEALDVLNERARPLIAEPYVTREIRQRFHLARARAIGDGVRQLSLQGAANHERIVGEYVKAEEEGAELTPGDVQRLTESLIELGRFEQAVARIDGLGDESGEARIALRRELIVAAEPTASAVAQEQLLRLEADPMLSVEDRAWVVARQTERRLADGYTDEAIARLLRTMPRIASASEPARGELLLLLGMAYADAGAFADSEKQLDRAAELIEPGGPLFARLTFERGNVLASLDRPEEARELFDVVVGSYASSPSFLPATLALAEVISLIAREIPSSASVTDAVDAYSRAADEALFAEASPEFIGRLTTSLLRRFEEHMVRGEFDTAAQYAQIAEDLYGFESTPADVLAAQGRVNQAQAERMVADAANAAGREIDLADLDPTTRVQAQRWYMRAGDYFRRHADAIAGDADDEGYAESLWASARMFDSAGDTAEAIASYIEFATTISDDPRLPEAEFHLARAYQSVGQYELAAERYESLLTIANDPERGTGVGPFAVMSYVPLAETYLEDGDPSNDQRASDLLEAVIRGEAGGVDSEAFNDALTAMGMVRYYEQDYPRAIEALEEAVARGGDPRELLRLKYLLADAYRLEAESIRETLGEGAIAPTVARRLEDTRTSHLSRAIELFAQARDEGSRVPPPQRTAIEGIYLRNAHFYLGDCAFDLGDYDNAIRYYGVARDAYADEPASLVALVQIFNAYLELGDLDRARTASERARRFYERLPDDVWDDPSLPVSRVDWERWLDSTYELASMRSANYTE